MNALYKISGCLNMIRQPENNNPVFRLPFPRINPIPTQSPRPAASPSPAKATSPPPTLATTSPAASHL
ncbi:hypothetical protein [Kingella sp. (in: b-proteobacteria)]|uniref:hypothetical protein n=1 Tax=Kingella sp. (in: b-proteobacteria) TaxID=2020713 RepID=UPI0026DC04F4|nr:hypothetical protein [Kingella sp. (in: b-proteobacteria)]MDO4656916.1 hypothetical protein [Kingella sp. (in: b-proteobacteria)]